MSNKIPFKDIPPGTAVEVPPEWGAGYFGGREALVMGAEGTYDHTGKINTSYVWPELHVLHGHNNTIAAMTVPNKIPATMPWKVLPEERTKELQSRLADSLLNGKYVMRKGTAWTTGSDPEIFVKVGDQVLNAFDFLESNEGSQQEFQKRVAKMQEGGAPDGVGVGARAFWDGFQAEFNVNPANCLESVTYNIREGLYRTLSAARKKHANAKLSLENVVEIPLSTLAELDEKYVILGCTPSRNIYGDKGQEVAEPRRLQYRFAGGHLTYGVIPTNDDIVSRTVRSLDAVLGVCAVSMAANIDNPIRRRFYGLAGEYRLPAYGIEYRTLSNFWLCHPAIGHLTMELFRVALNFGRLGLCDLLWKANAADVRKVINTCDVAAAREMIATNSKVLAALLTYTNFPHAEGVASPTITLAMETILKGVEHVIPDPTDIEGNWKLDMFGKVDKNGRRVYWDQRLVENEGQWGILASKRLAKKS